ncbi:MAG: hypothetical protein COV29_03840 [Candidatus Yanofskybacteria bacterium CG10_big_fil_rev_8_21_14_0_10_36_16]|uniref:Fibronectin type-III domain-containing protein n=1 Tax=Candidatus Yanofskybacteria bacterium CG10_big_fil_rev_8_21_14_0_10_36_16 TaxID=1975096 RepID=A0A2J0Q9D3_9BACT|nr:MAG: hypothetical protein COV29_03840 [Candidatus Yanofskybacteria bacterium CG10_big_fil_rev_8_21_14_0_10_36_16]
MRNSFGTVLAQKNNVFINPIPLKEGGTRFHINLPAQVPLNINEVYELEIISDMGGLGLYYGASVEILQHDSEYNISYIPGKAVIDNEEQSWTFKYATYESQDAQPPELSNISATVTNSNTVEINFNANEPVDWSILWGFEGQDYNQQTGFKNYYTSCLPGIGTCNTPLQVNPNTAYDYQIIAKDEWGNISQRTGSFNSAVVDTEPTPTGSPESTPPPQEVFSTPPAISGTTISELTDDYVKITWQTNKAANSSLLISLDQDGNSVVANVGDATYELAHSLSVSGLEPNTEYFARITSTNPGVAFVVSKNLATIISSSNNDTSSWQILTFKTAEAPLPDEAPNNEQPSNNEIETSQETDGIESTVNISWQAPSGGEPTGGYRVDVFDENNILVKQITVPAGEHSTTAEDLPRGDYTVVVYEDNEGTLDKIAPPAISRAPEPSITNTQVVIIGILILVLAGLIKIWLSVRKKNKFKKTITPPSSDSSSGIELGQI